MGEFSCVVSSAERLCLDVDKPFDLSQQQFAVVPLKEQKTT